MTAERVAAYVGLGSNLQQPVRQVRSALIELDDIPDTCLIKYSPLYRSNALGPAGQPDYINAVAMLRTGLDAHTLLDGLQAIELRHGRVRGERWGPRTLDLDLLLFGDQTINSTRLQVPHPEMQRRAFVLIPLHDIAPELDISGSGSLAQWLRGISNQGLQRLQENDEG